MFAAAASDESSCLWGRIGKSAACSCFCLSSPYFHSVLRQELRAQRVWLRPRSRRSGSRSVMAALQHQAFTHCLCPTVNQALGRLYSLKRFYVETNQKKKELVHIWLYFIIKAIKTEPCPYVYIWSGVTVMSEGGQRGTGDDHVLSFFLILLSHMVRWEGRHNRDLLEELVDWNGFEFLSWMS